MKHLLVLTIGICLLVSVPSIAERAEDEVAIRAAMDRMYAALNRHDAKGVVAEMDESFETWEGDMKGLAAREKYWEGFFEANKEAKIELLNEIGIIFVKPDVAIFKARGQASGWGGLDGEFLSAHVFARKNGRWLEVAAFTRPVEE
jgi:ketosteroid isomerase-like protein